MAIININFLSKRHYLFCYCGILFVLLGIGNSRKALKDKTMRAKINGQYFEDINRQEAFSMLGVDYYELDLDNFRVFKSWERDEDYGLVFYDKVNNILFQKDYGKWASVVDFGWSVGCGEIISEGKRPVKKHVDDVMTFATKKNANILMF